MQWCLKFLDCQLQGQQMTKWHTVVDTFLLQQEIAYAYPRGLSFIPQSLFSSLPQSRSRYLLASPYFARSLTAEVSTNKSFCIFQHYLQFATYITISMFLFVNPTENENIFKPVRCQHPLQGIFVNYVLNLDLI